jgi:small subunit ribosomal protein S19e
MPTLHDAPPEELIDAVADELADRVQPPDWTDYATAGVDRDLPPEDDDFWATRAASLLRRVAIDGPVGVERLSTAYGGTARGTNRYRVRPPHRVDGSKNVIRTILQQLEAADLVSTASGEGRVATPEGQRLLDETAGEVLDDLDRPELERYA